MNEASELKTILDFHPRAQKLMRKRKKFIVIAVDEPYFKVAFDSIRDQEKRRGTWTEGDEAWYAEAIEEWAENECVHCSYEHPFVCEGCIIGAARPKVICLCGSTRFLDVERRVYADETQAGHIVVSHSGERVDGEQQKKILDDLHLWKIDLADEVLILNVGGYVGESTTREIQYAQKTGKRIRWLEPGNEPPWFLEQKQEE